MLVVLIAATFSWLSGTYVVQGLTVLLAVCGGLGWRRQLPMLSWAGLLIVTVGLFIAKYFFLPVDERNPEYSLGHAAAQCLLFLQALQLVIHPREEQRGRTFVLLGAFALLGAGLIRVDARQNLVYQSTVLLFVALAACYFGAGRAVQGDRRATGRAGRLAIMLVMLLTASTLSVAGSRQVHSHWREIETYLNEKLKLKENLPDTSGALVQFRKRAELGSVSFRKSQLEKQIALRIVSDGHPAYLRGAVFDVYQLNTDRPDQWLADAIPRKREPAQALPAGFPRLGPGERAFFIRQEGGRITRHLEVWSEMQSESLFTELETVAVVAPVDTVHIDDHGIVESRDLPVGLSYRLWGKEPGAPPALAVEERDSLTAVPPELLREFADLRDKIFAGRTTTPAKIAALEEYFDAHYQYHLGLEVPHGQRPLTYFLREKPAAHCEYFASASTLLLRMAGVPSRYVIGYVPGEYNSLGGYWIARQEHAHAWAEAYVEGVGWQVVETTPSAGIPRESARPEVSHLWDNLLLKLRMIRSLLSRGGQAATWQALWILFTALFTTLPGLVVTTILSVILFRLLRPLWKLNRPRGQVSPRVSELQRLLARVDKRLSRRDIRRRPGETLHQFAERLRALPHPALHGLADWYVAYAEIRYCQDESAERVRTLAERANTLPA